MHSTMTNLHGSASSFAVAVDGETLETLDHVERTLDSDMLVIADAERAVALAGVMGGTDYRSVRHHHDILLESASFDMKSVRRTSRLLKLRSDASARFERGVDPNLASVGIARALELLLEVSPGAEIVEIADVYPAPVEPRTLTMDFDRIEHLLGIGFPASDVERVLDRPRVRSRSSSKLTTGRTLTVTIPTFRSDVSIPEDIVEEVGRIMGYDKVPATLPVGRTVPVVRDPNYLLQTKLRHVLAASGASEAVTYITVVRGHADDLPELRRRGWSADSPPLSKLVKLVNPLNAERPYLRNTLIPSLLEAVSANLRHQRRVSLFELARVYLPAGRNELPTEVQTLGIVMAGSPRRTGSLRDRRSARLLRSQRHGRRSSSASQRARLSDSKPATAPGFHPGRTANILVDDRIVGILGELHPQIAAAFDIEGAAGRCCGDRRRSAGRTLGAERHGQSVRPGSCRSNRIWRSSSPGSDPRQRSKPPFAVAPGNC